MSLVDRAEAGRALATQVAALRWPEPFLVLALTPSSVPVAYEVARVLHAELDLREVRPFYTSRRPREELGVVASGGVRVVHAHVQSKAKLSDEDVARAAEQVEAEIRADEHSWRRRHPRTALGGNAVALVSDVIADNRVASAVWIARIMGASRVLVACATGVRSVLAQLRNEADAVVCLSERVDPASLQSVFAGALPPAATEIAALLERAEEWRAPVPVG